MGGRPSFLAGEVLGVPTFDRGLYTMLSFAFGSLIVAVILGFFGFGRVVGYSWEGAQVLSVLFLAASFGAAVGSRFRKASW